jgi:hypothetical protein
VTSHLNRGLAVEVFVCNECFVFVITLCCHFKILFHNINLLDTESLGHVGWMVFLSILNIILVTVSLGLVVLISVHKLRLYFPKLGDVINLPPSIVTCDFTVVSLKAFYDLLLKLTWARFFASLYLAI